MAQKRKPTKSASSKTKKDTLKSKTTIVKKKTHKKVDESKMEVLNKGLDKLNKNFKCLIGECEKALNTLLDSNNNTEIQIQPN
jgi:hypothetical protein